MDLLYAFRLLRKTPLFTISAVLILAFAIGGNLVSFSLIDAVMLRSIPVSHPEQLIKIDMAGPRGPVNGMPSTAVDLLAKDPAFSGACGFTTPRITTEINGSVASTGTLAMTGDCFRTLGVSTQIGRPFAASDDLPEAANVVVLTARLWHSSFGGSPAAIGRQIRAGVETYTVIGVATEDFTGVLLGFEAGVIVPLHHIPTDTPNRRYAWFWTTVFARCAPGVSVESATARIQTIAPTLLAESVPLRYNQSQRKSYLASKLVVTSARTGVDWMLRNRFGPSLYALWAICAAILLIAVLNLAGLLVARSVARAREMDIRLAIGANRWRVVRPLVMEGILLTVMGGASGLLLASFGRGWIVSQASAMFGNFTLDTTFSTRAVLLLAGLLLIVTVGLTGVPVWQSRQAHHRLRAGLAGRGVIPTGTRGQKMLLAVQVAFTLALVAATGMFTSGFRNLANLRLGLRTQGVAEAMLSPLPAGYGSLDPKPYYEGLLERVASLPGIRHTSLSSFALYWNKIVPDPVRTADGVHEARAQVIRISDGYFQTIGVHLNAGEDFARNHTQPEAIVSESLARALGGNPLGTSISLGETGNARQYRIVGIAPTVRISMADARDANQMAIYLNFWQEPREQRYPVLLIDGVPDAKALDATVQSLGREYVESFRTLDAAHDESITEDRLMAWLSGIFAVLNYFVARRTGEIGLRMALGATGADIRRVVLLQLAPVVLIGVTGGFGLALVAGRAISGIVFGVSAAEPLTLAAAIAALILTSALAAWIPARRAAAIQPIEALRQE